MTVEEALGRIARAKENIVMAQRSVKDLWAEWMERRQTEIGHFRGRPGGVMGASTPEQMLDKIIERLELALTDAKTVRDNLKAASQ